METITKDRIVKAVQELPEDATLADAIKRLLFLHEIEEGLEQSRRGEGISQAEMEARVRSWPD